MFIIILTLFFFFFFYNWWFLTNINYSLLASDRGIATQSKQYITLLLQGSYYYTAVLHCDSLIFKFHSFTIYHFSVIGVHLYLLRMDELSTNYLNHLWTTACTMKLRILELFPKLISTKIKILSVSK